MAAKTAYLASKPRYEILDGLRGVASLIVVLFHILEVYSGGQVYQVINHGYLAVDFFFALSGFVVGYAYDDRWDRMTVTGFFKRRLVRLHPMVVMGTVIGLCFYYLGQGDGFALIGSSPWWKVIAVFVMGCLMIPCWPKMDIRGWVEPYSGADLHRSHETVLSVPRRASPVEDREDDYPEGRLLVVLPASCRGALHTVRWRARQCAERGLQCVL